MNRIRTIIRDVEVSRFFADNNILIPISGSGELGKCPQAVRTTGLPAHMQVAEHASPIAMTRDGIRFHSILDRLPATAWSGFLSMQYHVVGLALVLLALPYTRSRSIRAEELLDVLLIPFMIENTDLEQSYAKVGRYFAARAGRTHSVNCYLSRGNFPTRHASIFLCRRA